MNTARYRLTIMHGLVVGLLAGALAAVVPWLFLELLLLTRRLGTDVDPSADGARFGSYWLGSIAFAAAFATFGTRPRSSGRFNVQIVAGVAVLIPAIAFTLEGPRYKAHARPGSKPTDIIWLTVPAIVTGVVLLTWRMPRDTRDHSANMQNPPPRGGG